MLITIITCSSILIAFYVVIGQLRDVKDIDDRLNETYLFYDARNKLHVPTLPLIANEIQAQLILAPKEKDFTYDVTLKLSHKDPIINFYYNIHRIEVCLVDYDTREQLRVTTINVDKSFNVELGQHGYSIYNLDKELNVKKHTHHLFIPDEKLIRLNLSFNIHGSIKADLSDKSNMYIPESIPIIHKNLRLFGLEQEETYTQYPRIISERKTEINDKYDELFN